MRNNDKTYRAKFSTSFPIKGQVIGIDLDGVLGNLAEGVINKARIKYGLAIELKDITSHRLQECTPLTDLQVKEIFESTDIFQTLNPIPEACETLKELRGKNWIIQVITDRFWTKQDWSIAKTWLEQNGFEWDYLNLVRAQEKASYAKTHGISIFVEDNYDTAVSLSSVCNKVYLLNWPYNQGSLPNNTIRVSTWKEILRDLLQ